LKKRVISIVCVILLVFAAAVVCSEVFFKHTAAENICDGVIRLETATKDSSGISNAVLAYLYGQEDVIGGSCSAVVKTLDDGDTVAGRNFDMARSHFPVFMGSTDIEGFYPTVYVTNLVNFGPDYDSCVKKGVPRYMSCIVPFVACDSLNSEGLYMQINMRMNQKDEDGNYVFSCSGTNEDAEIRLNALELPSYVTMRCKNTAEAVELINSVDIYTLNDTESWPFCFLIADAEGNCGLLELGCNEARWLPGQNMQTNFYISEDFNAIQIYKQGLGRYEYLEENLESVKTEDDMLSLMEGVKFSELYDLDSPNYDTRSELAGSLDYLTNEYLDNEENWNDAKNEYRELLDQYSTLSEEEKIETGQFWISLYTAVVNCTQKTLSLSFFEEYDIRCVLDFK